MRNIKRNIKLIVEYDGTAFVGWQLQRNGLSVQEVIERALARLTGEQIRVVGAGRTDSGVHALGQVVSFKTGVGHAISAFREGLNALLPDEVAVLSAEEMPPEFHALVGVRSKLYRYEILNTAFRRPLLRLRAWHVSFPLDRAAMVAAAERVVGEHDFQAFCTAESKVVTTVRRILSAEVHEWEADLLRLEFAGEGFLHQMVRRLAGVLVEVGRGARPVEWVDELLTCGQRAVANPAAPPHGLYKVEVRY